MMSVQHSFFMLSQRVQNSVLGQCCRRILVNSNARLRCFLFSCNMTCFRFSLLIVCVMEWITGGLVIFIEIITNFQFQMDSSKEEKQEYLRDHILSQNYDPAEFVEFLNSKIPIGDNIDLISYAELVAIVEQFIEIEEQGKNSFEPLAEGYNSPVEVSQISSKKMQAKESKISESDKIVKEDESDGSKKPSVRLKQKQILFTKYSPHLLENEDSKTFQCTKIIDKYNYLPSIKCIVSDPQRKSIGGIFGILATSFLEFKITTLELNWKVGRRYSDFIWLRSYLLKVYPNYLLPPIPEKKASKKTSRHIQKRMRILEYFLNDLVAIREVLNDKFVEGFLSLTDSSKFDKLKEQSQKVKASDSLAEHCSFEGKVQSKLSEQNKVFLDEMQEKIPIMQSIYKQITRGGKRLQSLIADEVNTLYSIGNLFADLHEKTREVVNKIPKTSAIARMNDVFITLNNMMIEWGNINRTQNEFLEKNFNTFFKYIRHQLRGFNESFSKEQQFEMEYARLKQALEKKKEKIYNMHDPQKWELTSKELNSLPKELIHDKAKALKVMLPKETSQIEKMRNKLFYMIDQIHFQGSLNFERTTAKFCENFKQFTIKMKVSNQQLCEMWMEQSSNFSGPKSKPAKLMQRPIQEKDQQIYDD